jgi:hypothetical protein
MNRVTPIANGLSMCTNAIHQDQGRENEDYGPLDRRDLCLTQQDAVNAGYVVSFYSRKSDK